MLVGATIVSSKYQTYEKVMFRSFSLCKCLLLERYYVLCSRLFENIVSDPNHKLKALLPPDYDNSRYNLRLL